MDSSMIFKTIKWIINQYFIMLSLLFDLNYLSSYQLQFYDN